MINRALFSSNSNEWATPQSLFDELDREFNFTLDPCSTHENAKCKKHYTIKEDGLKQSWGGESVFCNPPYGRTLHKWVEKAWKESTKPNTIVVMLIPSRTDTQYFHDYILHRSEIRFIKNRLCFNDGNGRAPFPSMIVIFRSGGGRNEEKKVEAKEEQMPLFEGDEE